MIIVESKRRKINTLQKEYPGAYILDITSSSESISCRKLSPFYPHGNISIPGESANMTACSVEGIWQGLKVFENASIDTSSFNNNTMKNIKRTVRKFGKPLGHQYGVYSKTLLNYLEAKRLIYAPAYKYVLEQIPEVKLIIEKIKKEAETSIIVLLDYNINPDNRDSSKPLSHAELVKMYIEGRYPESEQDFKPWINEELSHIKKTSRCKLYSTRVRVHASDLPSYLDEIIMILKSEERTACDLAKILNIEITSKSLETFLEQIPNIIITTDKRKKIYTLKSSKEITILF